MTGEHKIYGQQRRAPARPGLMLRGGFEVLVLAGAVSAAAHAQQSTAAATSLVFDRVTVVDVVREKLVPDQRVVIVGNRIQAVGSAGKVKMPTSAQVVDARGKYLIPGLWDMHAHAAGDINAHRNVYSLLVANGVTGIREMMTIWPAGFDSVRQQRREIASGTLVGPRIVATSHDFYSPVCTPEDVKRIARIMYNMENVDADSNPPDSVLSHLVPASGCMTINPNTVTTPNEVRRMVDTLKARGVDFVKAHGISDPKIYFAFLAEARRIGIPAVGHLGGLDGPALTESEASDSGLRSVEHINEVGCWLDKSESRRDTLVPLPDSIAEKQCAAVAERFRRNGTWLVPTLFVFYPVLGSVSDSAPYLRAVRLLHRVGIPMLAGTDAYTEHDVGEQMLESALHKEMVLLVRAGFTPAAAIRAATLDPAKFFGATDSLGTIASGKLADLVLLDADPLADIHNTRTIRAVVANGRYFDRAALDGLLAEGRAKAKQNP